MPYLYFELQEPAERQEEYGEILRQHSVGLQKSVEYLLRALQLMMGVQTPNGQHYHGVVFLLARHVAEEVDAASVLVAEGCIGPCKAHLRSAFEAELGAHYILESDSEQRGLAYLVKQARDRIRWYDKTDPKSAAGRELRSQIGSDNIANGVLSSMPPFDFDAAKDGLSGMLHRPPFDAMNDEWQRLKKVTNRHPAWHALFDGPRTIRDLAFHLGRGFWYEYLYSDWSGHLHAGSVLQHVGASSGDSTGELKAFRPLRHPDGLKDVYNFGEAMLVWLGNRLGERYLSQIGRDDLRDFYIKQIRPINESLKGISIKADWR